MRLAFLAVLVVAVAGCATQRYGRQAPVSSGERAILTCETIALEIAKTEGFLEDVRRQRGETSAAHVFGALGDFGIGNVMEGDATEASAITRLDQLRALQSERSCPAT